MPRALRIPAYERVCDEHIGKHALLIFSMQPSDILGKCVQYKDTLRHSPRLAYRLVFADCICPCNTQQQNRIFRGLVESARQLIPLHANVILQDQSLFEAPGPCNPYSSRPQRRPHFVRPRHPSLPEVPSFLDFPSLPTDFRSARYNRRPNNMSTLPLSYPPISLLHQRPEIL